MSENKSESTNEFAKQVSTVSLEDEMRQSYLDYAMSVIVGRALPDVRDGLKPVHRRILYSMDKSGYSYNKKHVKSAKIVGDVMGQLHPHGDSAIYDTMVRMAQNFSMRETLVDGQGNFGSVDGDSAAAMRYTESRMSKIAQQLLADIDKETVNFIPNYDNTEVEPSVLPTKIPNILINGGTGIAVGMATNIPTHNLSETISACLLMLDKPDASIDELLTVLPGPDFPTGAMINGAEGIRKAYETGRGRLHIRSKTHIETDASDGRQAIVVDELPYQVNKSRLLEKISELVKEKAIEGISGLRDESDKDGIRMVIELKRGEVAEVVLNNLYRQTQLQTVFGINMVALLDGRPQLLGLKPIINAFLKHRREVVTRRTIFDLRKTKARVHVLEGLAAALNNIDPIIELIKKSSGPAEAKTSLQARGWLAGNVLAMLERAGPENSRPDNLPEQYGLHDGNYHLSPEQAQAILDLRLHRLTGLEQEKIYNEYKEIIAVIENLLDILTNPQRLISEIRTELEAVKEQYGNPRRTVIIDKHLDLTLEDLIAQENLVVTWSHQGYVKSQPLGAYEAQRRGGRGKSATATKDDDFVERVFVANTHDTLLSFTNLGRLYWTKVYELPQAGRNAKGRPIVNILNLSEDEKVEAVMAIQAYDADKFIFFVTQKGQVKKTPLTAYQNQRANGVNAITLRDGDQLLAVGLTDGKSEIMLFSDNGKVARFAEDAVRSMGRTASGVRGIRLKDEGKVVGMVIVGGDAGGAILTVTENGYGKRTDLVQYPVRGRGTQGVISIQTSERNGRVVSAILVEEDEDAMLITNGGVLIRTKAAGVSKVGRNTQGVRLIRLDKKEKLIALARVAPEEESDEQDTDVADNQRLITADEQLNELGDITDSYESSDTDLDEDLADLDDLDTASDTNDGNDEEI